MKGFLFLWKPMCTFGSVVGVVVVRSSSDLVECSALHSSYALCPFCFGSSFWWEACMRNVFTCDVLYVQGHFFKIDFYTNKGAGSWILLTVWSAHKIQPNGIRAEGPWEEHWGQVLWCLKESMDSTLLAPLTSHREEHRSSNRLYYMVSNENGEVLFKMFIGIVMTVELGTTEGKIQF